VTVLTGDSLIELPRSMFFDLPNMRKHEILMYLVG